jgi:hypothetical protein
VDNSNQIMPTFMTLAGSLLTINPDNNN